MEYLRLCGSNFKGKPNGGFLISINENPYNHVNVEEAFYLSTFIYNDEHKAIFDKTGSIAGITDVTTDRLYWDFDAAADLDKAKADATVLCERLIEEGFPKDAIRVAFSGAKGFDVTVKTNSRFTPEEVGAIASGLADGLATFDKTMYNAARVFRLPGTKHFSTKLYKLPLTLEQLRTHNAEQIKTLATDLENCMLKPLSPVPVPSLINRFKAPAADAPSLPPPSAVPVADLDFKTKPKGFTNCKFAIMNGMFSNGVRNSALMALAATCKAQGYPKKITYGILKGAAHMQAERAGDHVFPKDEIWHNIIGQVYGPHWKGAQFSCQKQDWLKEICDGLGSDKCRHDEERERVYLVDEMHDQFEKYSMNIDKNTVKTGIAALDDNVQLTIGMPVALLGAPSSGKCLGFNTPVRMFDGSIKMVQDIVIGDVLMGDDSTPRNVLSTCTGREKLYRVDQLYGDSYVVNESHILSLMCGASFENPKLAKKYQVGKKSDLSVVEYLNSSAKFRKYYKGYKVGVEYPHTPVTLDPYFLGYWLGNGDSTGPSASFDKRDGEVFDFLSVTAAENGLKMSQRNEQSVNGATYYLSGSKKQANPITTALKTIGVLENKHIPNLYLRNSRKVRLELLAGIIDSDGYYCPNKKCFEVTFKPEVMADGLVELCRSLGFRAVKNDKRATWNSFTKNKWYSGEGNYFRVYIGGEGLEEIPTILPRKKAEPVKRARNSLLSAINLTDIGEGNYYGFEIDGNKRFLLGDFTVTHNTSLSLNILKNTSAMGISSLFFSFDMYSPILYLKKIQNVTGLNSYQVHEIMKHHPRKAAEIKEQVKEAYKHVKFCTKSGLTVQEMRDVVTEHQERTGDKVKLILTDYLECISGPHADPTANSSKIAGELKDFANEMEVCKITLVQPPKSAGDASYPLTSMRQIKGSSMLEQSFRVVFGIYREGFGPTNPQDDRYITINTLKNTMGPLFSHDFAWSGIRGDIAELDDHGIMELKQLRNRKQNERAKKEQDTW